MTWILSHISHMISFIVFRFDVNSINESTQQRDAPPTHKHHSYVFNDTPNYDYYICYYLLLLFIIHMIESCHIDIYTINLGTYERQFPVYMYICHIYNIIYLHVISDVSLLWGHITHLLTHTHLYMLSVLMVDWFDKIHTINFAYIRILFMCTIYIYC